MLLDHLRHVSNFRFSEPGILTFSLNLAIQLTQWLISLNFLINRLVRECNRHNHTREIQQIDRTRITIILELIMSDRSSRSDWCNNRINFLAKFLLHESELLEIFGLESPFLQVHGPKLIHVDLGERRIDQVSEVGNSGLAGLFERVENIGSTIRGVYAVDEVNGEVVLVGGPGEDCMPRFLQCRDNGFNATENRWMWEDLKFVSKLTHFVYIRLRFHHSCKILVSSHRKQAWP